VQPQPRTSGALQSLDCALAVFVPFAMAARLLGWDGGGGVPPHAVGGWVHAAGHPAMEPLQAALTAGAQGHGPRPAPLTAAEATVPLALGAAGVMVPLRPNAGAPRGKLRGREVTVGVLARLGQPRTRTGQSVPRLQHRRLGAV
jgi:hypothetical protein